MNPKDVHHYRPQYQGHEEDAQERGIAWITFVTLYGEIIFQVVAIFLRVILCDEVLTLDDGEDAVGNPRKHQIESYERHIQELFLPFTSILLY